MMKSSVHLKVHHLLRERATACGEVEGMTLPEFIRAAMREKCERIERSKISRLDEVNRLNKAGQ